MLRKEMNKEEIERELAGKGDYVLIDNITRFLKENLSQDIKRLIYTKLLEIYEKRNMFFEAADIYRKLSEIAIKPSDRISYVAKEVECYIKSGVFEKADAAIAKISEDVKQAEKNRIMTSVIGTYKKQAEIYEKERRRNRAAKTYEKILTMKIPEEEKEEIRKKLSILYNELGMVEEYMKIKNKI